MEVYLSDFSQGNIRAFVTQDQARSFLVDIPQYRLSLTLVEEEEEWRCSQSSGIYNPAWINEIVWQIRQII
ncbi:hypothetical protein [Daejeonella lutea]|uniref:Uncharacterized protein n=1 Tax=Daejeonella lutea TaxID=572036 RepID=A0A1T5BL43_9SPHI|nr:hypothetical protein [Daejeonella lutea]SKB48001.1 hypothetical protein SAMN05661099_1603 [Daejeonella lutea]